MDAIDGTWHLLNLLAPAFVVALIAAGATKLLWRRRLKQTPWWRLFGWASLAGVTVLLGGLWVSGSDGRMATYALLVVAEAVALLLAGRLWRG